MFSTFQRDRSLRHRQRFAACLSLAVCLWFIAVASHVHVRDETASSTNASHACSFCLSAPTAGGVPALIAHVLSLFTAQVQATIVIASLITGDPPSPYFGRGPPH